MALVDKQVICTPRLHYPAEIKQISGNLQKRRDVTFVFVVAIVTEFKTRHLKCVDYRNQLKFDTMKMKKLNVAIFVELRNRTKTILRNAESRYQTTSKMSQSQKFNCPYKYKKRRFNFYELHSKVYNH